MNEDILELVNFFKERFWMIFWVCMEERKRVKDIREFWGRSKSSIYQKYKGRDPISEMKGLGVIEEVEQKHGDRRYKYLKAYPKVFPKEFQELFKKNEDKMRKNLFKIENLKILVKGNTYCLVAQWLTVVSVITMISMKPELFIQKKVDLVEEYKFLLKKRLGRENFNKIKDEIKKDFTSLKKLGELVGEKKQMPVTEMFPLLNVKGYVDSLNKIGYFDNLQEL